MLVWPLSVPTRLSVVDSSIRLILVVSIPGLGVVVEVCFRMRIVILMHPRIVVNDRCRIVKYVRSRIEDTAPLRNMGSTRLNFMVIDHLVILVTKPGLTTVDPSVYVAVYRSSAIGAMLVKLLIPLPSLTITFQLGLPLMPSMIRIREHALVFKQVLRLPEKTVRVTARIPLFGILVSEGTGLADIGDPGCMFRVVDGIGGAVLAKVKGVVPVIDSQPVEIGSAWDGLVG